MCIVGIVLAVFSNSHSWVVVKSLYMVFSEHTGMTSDARVMLQDVGPTEVFRTCNGVFLNNLSELLNYLQGCSDYDFQYHVNVDHHKNDFAIWVRESIRDAKLADELDGELDRQRYLQKVKTRLQQLSRMS